MHKLLQTPFVNLIGNGPSWEQYGEMEGMNPSTAVNGLISMKHVHHAMTEGSKKQTAAMRDGSAVHAWILEQGEFYKRYAIFQGKGTRRSKEYHEFAEEHEGMDILYVDEFDNVRRCADAVRDDPLARDVLDATQHEVTLQCGAFDMQCKGRVDCLGSNTLADVKGTSNVEKSAFGRVFANLHYAIKLNLYKTFAEILGQKIDNVIIICHEQKPPYDVAVVPIPDIILDNAMPRTERLMQRIYTALDTGVWPGVADGDYYELSVPNWAMDEEEILDWS